MGWSSYLVRMYEKEVREASEIVRIESEQICNAVGQLDRHQAGIMHVLAFDIVGCDKCPPMSEDS